MSIEFKDFTVFGDGDEDKPLVPAGGCGEGDGQLVFDESGDFVMADPTLTTTPGTLTPVTTVSLFRACSLQTLDGSWKLSVTPRMAHFFWSQIRGPMRIEAANNILRVSGDMYVSKPPWITHIDPRTVPATVSQPAVAPIAATSLLIRKNWYPSYPQNEYRWYFRSTGVSYSKTGSKGTLVFKFVRHIWSDATQEFVSSDAGWMKFECSHSLLHVPWFPQPTIKMEGEAMIGGQMYNVSAIKTSPYYRGCLVEVDVMVNRHFPLTATQCGGSTYSFSGVYRSHGLDFRAVVDETDVPEDPQLTFAEMQNLLTAHRSLATTTNQWRLWLLVGSRIDGTLGIIFDDIPPHREGVAGFYDPRLPAPPAPVAAVLEPSVHGEKLGDIPIAFMRTLVHEAGHAFNLYHPKSDCHSPAIGTTIMNQTGDVIGFATTTNRYPCNITMGFNEHNRTSLIHSPDPQVKPGWKKFGWGHDLGEWCGVPEPADVLGIESDPVSDDLELTLDVPAEIFPGELILANFEVKNVSDAAVPIATALNLSEGYLRLYVEDPSGDIGTVGDILVQCSDGRPDHLPPGESRFGTVQLLYTNRGYKFDQVGRYRMLAELDLIDGTGSIVRSEKAQLIVRPAITEQEQNLQEITLNEDVGRSLALGDFGVEDETKEKVAKVADEFPDTDTGAAFAMVMANSLGREFNDPLAKEVLRDADQSEKDRYFAIATKDRSLTEAAQLATAVAATRELQAPILEDIEQHIGDQRYKEEDRDQAQKVFDDYMGS